MSTGAVAGVKGAPSARRRFVVALELVLLVAAVALGVVAVLRERDRLGEAWGELGAPRAGLAAVLMLAGVRASAEVWLAALRAVGGEVPRRSGVPLFALSQVGKYLPGAAWPYLAQIRRLREAGVDGRRVVAGQLVFLLLHVGTGAVVAAAALALADGADALDGRWPYLVAAVAGLVVLSPPVLERLLRRVPRAAPPGGVDRRGLAAATGWMLVVWACYGASVGVLAGAYGGPALDVLLAATGAYALAWTVGFLVVVAPAGAGVREVVLVGVLSATVLDPVPALAVALVARALSTVADLALPVLTGGTAALGRRRRSGP